MSSTSSATPRPILSAKAVAPQKIVLAVLAASFFLQTILSLNTPGFATDVNCFGAWSESLLKLGPSQFYTAGFFADYPPGYLYYLWFIAWINKVLGFSPYNGMGLYFLTLLPILCNLILAYIGFHVTLKHHTVKSALLTGSLLAFLPPMLYDAAVWKQADSVFILALVISFLALEDKKWYKSAILYGVALLIKPQALFFGPVLAIAFLLPLLRSSTDKLLSADHEAADSEAASNEAAKNKAAKNKADKNKADKNKADKNKADKNKAAGSNGITLIVLMRTAFCALLSLGIIWLGALPFQGSQPNDWLIRQYTSATATYPYASVNAFNLFTGLGGNWASWDTGWIFSYKIWGTLLLCLATLFLFLATWRRRNQKRGDIVLLAAFYGMAVFTLGHGMHERYSLPGLIFLLLAWSYTGKKRLLHFSLVQCLLCFLNIVMALKLLENGSLMTDPSFILASRFVGLSQTVLLLFLFLYCFEIPTANLSQRLNKLIKWIPDNPASQAAAPCSPWCRRDVICLIIVTLLGAALSFPYLGDTKAPQTAWLPANQPAGLQLQTPAHMLWIYGGIGSGILQLTDQEGNILAQITMEENNLFNWSAYQLPPYKGVITLSSLDTVTVYEVVFTDIDGKNIPVTVSEGSEFLVDEQKLRPEYIDSISGMYFDEIYHGRTAYEYLNGLEPYETTHPPLGKELIGIGISLFGMTPFGWRFMGTLFGVLMLPLIYALARLLTGRTQFGLLAAALLGLDFMRFTQSRIATIDVYAVFFVMLSLLGMLIWLRMDISRTPLIRQLSALGLSGLGFGLSCAVKWTGVYAGAGLALLFFLSLWRYYQNWKATPNRRRDSLFLKRCSLILAGCVLLFVLLPLLLYASSYLFYFSKSGKPFTLEALWNIQKDMFDYHSSLVATHPFASRCFSWPLMLQPVWYSLAKLLPSGLIGSIAVLGNPVVWWIGLMAMVLLTILCVLKNRDRNIIFLIIAYLAQFVPWIFVDRLQFLYHYFGCVPILVLAIVYLLYLTSKATPRASVYIGWGLTTVALVLFLLFYPVISGMVVPTEYIGWLQWFPSWIFGA